MSVIFILALLFGGLGIQQMIAGAHAIRDKRIRAMTTHHLLGVMLLTMSAALSAKDIGDYSYLWMQLPFVLAALRAYVTPPARLYSRIMFLRPCLHWWSLGTAIFVNIMLVLTGMWTNVIEGDAVVTQVIGAAVVSSALCIRDSMPQRKLFFLTFGRVVLCGSSFAKCIFATTSWWPPVTSNAAALVWLVLMSWAAWESGRMLLHVRAQQTL